MITDEAISQSITTYNKYRRAMREFTEVAALYPQIIDPIRRHQVIKAGYLMEKGKYTKLVLELIEQLKQLPVIPWKGKKVVLTGITAEPDELLQYLVDFGIAVVGDDLAHESRQFREDVPEVGGNPLERLAMQWQNLSGCSLAYDTEKARMPMLKELCKKTGATGIINCMMKFCDPEEFDYPIMKKYMKDADIPLLLIDIDQQASSFEQAKTRLQGFAEMI